MNFAAKHRVNRDLTRIQRRRMAASGLVTPILVALLAIGLLAATYNHIHGNFHRLRISVLKPEPSAAHVQTGPGGQPAVHLSRTSDSMGVSPEFLSITLLPGRGLEVLQISAQIPGRGEINLLQTPGDAPESLLTGSGADLNGQLGATFGGAFLAPWAGTLLGTPSPATGRLEDSWQGSRISFPASPTPGASPNQSTDGLLLNRPSDSLQTGVVLDGQFADAMFRAGNFDNSWVSSLDIETRVELTGHAVTLTMTGHNVGSSPMPLGLGWKPYFAIPSGQREQAELYIPSNEIAAIDHHTGLPDGQWNAAPAGEHTFSAAGGTPLENVNLNATYSDLHSAATADGPMVELRDPASHYGLRMTLLSASITTLQVHSPAGAPWVQMEPATNASDPFARGWNGDGIRVLKPGETLTWKVRLELFTAPAGGRATP